MEKKNIGLIILVVVLIVVAITLGGFIVYDKVLSKEKTEVNNQENTNITNKIEKINLTDDQKENINQIMIEYDIPFRYSVGLSTSGNIVFKGYGDNLFESDISRAQFTISHIVRNADNIDFFENDDNYDSYGNHMGTLRYLDLDYVCEYSEKLFGKPLIKNDIKDLLYYDDELNKYFIIYDEGDGWGFDSIMKVENITLNKETDIYTLKFNKYSMDPNKIGDEFNNMYSAKTLTIDEKYFVGTTEIEYKKNDNSDIKYNILSYTEYEK